MNNSEKKILKQLIKSCVEIDSKIFLNELKKQNVTTNMPNKMRFYKFFKFMIKCLNNNSDKILHYKWKKIVWMKQNKISLQIFDKTHRHSRLTFVIENRNEKIYIETLPF